MKRTTYPALLVVTVALTAVPLAAQDVAGTAFTYQGFLQDANEPVNGTVELTFGLWRDPTGVDPNDLLFTLPPITGVSVTDGYFTVEVDCGEDVFVGEALWLEVDVDGQTLSPRQAITPAPYALALPGVWTHQNDTSPSVLAGYAGNVIDPGYVGGVICGGGAELYAHPGYPPDPNDPNDPNDPGDPNEPPVPGENRVTADYATVCGGTANQAGGGDGPRAEGDGNNSFIGGGSQNDANGAYSTIGGGYKNTANGNYTSIIGGRENKCGNGTTHEYGVVCGGKSNQVNQDAAFVGAGFTNNASGVSSVICGGEGNTASGYVSVVCGGTTNSATRQGASVLGGYNNTVRGYYSSIVGGNGNTIDDYDDYSLVFGKNVRCTRSKAVMFFDHGDYGMLAINRDSDNSTLYRPLIVGMGGSNGNGAYLTQSGNWVSTGSKRSESRELRCVDRGDLFDRIDALRIGPFELEVTGERHFGVFAEDFHALFEVGALREDGARDTSGLAAADVAGVALAGVQELIRENDELRDRVDRLEELVELLLERQP